MDDEWYNSPDWDAAAQADFLKRLSRARTHRAHYLKIKTAAIADAHPLAALDLCDFRIASGDEEECASAKYAKANIYGRIGDIQKMMEVLNDAIGVDGQALGAPAAGEFCCLVGFFGRDDLFLRAIGILDELDGRAMRELGRPFGSFAFRAARALIDFQRGHTEQAKEPAEEALRLALDRTTPIPGSPVLTVIPKFPSTLYDRLLVVAGLWNAAELGDPPDV